MKNYAVLVGINQYLKYRSLKYAQSDANSLRDKLVNRPEGVFLTENIYVLVDAAVGSSSPIRTNILVAIREICKKASKDDLILFYFAGHGFESPTDGLSYLVTNDTHPSAPSETALAVDSLLKIMNESQAAKKVMILDACRNSVELDPCIRTILENEIQPGPFGDTLQRTVVTGAKQPGWELIIACGPNQFALETDEFEGGVWTHFLLKAVNDLGHKRDITVSSLFNKAELEVKNWAKNKGKEQTPYYQCNRPGDSAIIFPATKRLRPGNITTQKTADFLKIIVDMKVNVMFKQPRPKND